MYNLSNQKDILTCRLQASVSVQIMVLGVGIGSSLGGFSMASLLLRMAPVGTSGGSSPAGGLEGSLLAPLKPNRACLMFNLALHSSILTSGSEA